MVKGLFSGKSAEKLHHAYIADENVKMIKQFGKLQRFLIKLNMQFPYNLAINTPDKLTHVHKKNPIQEYLQQINSLYQFLAAAVTNNHRPDSFKQEKFILSQFQKPAVALGENQDENCYI